MRKLLFFALLAIPAFPAACTLTNNAGSACASQACAISAIAADTTHTNWTGTGCTANGYAPAAGASAGTGDTVTVPAGYALTIDQNWTIGANNATNGTAAITAAITAGNGSGQVFVNSGVTLTLRGDFIGDTGWLSPWPLTMNAGSTLVMDSSLSASPSTTRYRIGDFQFISSGTSTSHVAVTSCAAGNASFCASPGTPGLPAQFSISAVGSYPTSNQGTAYNSTYTDFSYMGDATTYGWFSEAVENGSDSTNFQHNTLNHCGPWYSPAYGFGPTTVTNFSFNTWTNSPQALTVPNLGVSFEPTFTSGSRTISNNVFDTCAQVVYASNVTWNNNFMGAGFCNVPTPTAQTWNFVNQLLPIELYGLPIPSAGLTNGYYLIDYAAADNPHWTGFPSASAAMSGYIFESDDDFISDSGEMYSNTQTSSGAYTQTFNNNIELPTKTGKENSEISSPTYAITDTSLVMNDYHNTWVGGTGFGMHQTNESGATVVPANALESNLSWSNGGAYYKVSTSQTTSLLQNPVTTADYNSADSNVTLTNSGCGGCTNQGKGYAGKWTATPGTHDVSASPYFADQYRNVPLWDTKYLGNALGTAWAASTAYSTPGQIVSDSHSGYWNGAAVNFSLLAPHTSSSYTEPNVGTYTIANGGLTNVTTSSAPATVTINFAVNPGLAAGEGPLSIGDSAAAGISYGPYWVTSIASNASCATCAVTLNPTGSGYSSIPASATLTDAALFVSTWHVFWGWQSLNDIKTATAAGTTYTDGAIGCAGCTAIQALVKWVQKGFTPQNPALWCSGHDGEAIGAVPFCASGKVLIGTLAGM